MTDRFAITLNPAELPSPKGWKARSTFAAMKKESREIELEGSRLRSYITGVISAEAELNRSIERRDNANNALNAKRSLYEVHRRSTIQSGTVRSDMQKLKFAIEEVLPETLANAEAEIAAARLRLAEAERRRDAAFAEAAANDGAEADPLGDEVGQVEPVEVKRGPGRPRKVQL